MFARLAVDGDLLRDIGVGLTVRQAQEAHRRVIRALHAHGKILLSSEDEIKRFSDSIKSDEVPAPVRRIWSEMLVSFLKNRPKRITSRYPSVDDFTSVESLENLADIWRNEVDIAVVSARLLELFGLTDADECLNRSTDGLEVTTAASLPACARLTRFEELMDVGEACYQSRRDDFWSEVLEPLARVSLSACVVDSYLFNRLIKGRRGVQEHVVWLLSRLNKALVEGSTVTLIGMGLGGVTVKEVADAIGDSWIGSGPTRIREVVVYLVPDPKFTGQRKREPVLPHDRHIRFDVGGAVTLPAGFDRLSGFSISDPDGMRWKYVWSPSTLASLRRSESRCIGSNDVQSLSIWP